MVFAGQSEEDNKRDESQYSEDEDAAFGTGGSTAENRLANGVCGEEVEFDHYATVGDAVEEGLPPVPRSVEADGPPE